MHLSLGLFSCLLRPVPRALLLGACALTALAPRAADACGVPAPELTSSVPADGATYPANAALLFSGFDITLDGVTVTVDGQPATFAPAEFAASFANIAVLVEPQPMPGQTVAVSGLFCPDEFCDPVSITYTAGEPDLTAPAPSADMAFFGVYDHADFMSGGGDCQSDRDLTFYVHVPQAAPAAGDALPLLHAAWDPDGDGPIPGVWGRGRAPDADARLVLTSLDEDLVGKDPATDLCFTIRMIDSAGNEAPSFDVCPACYFRKDDAPQDQVPPEPQWSDADAVPGSACAVASESTGAATDTGTDPTTGGTGDNQTTGDAQSTGDAQTDGDSATDTGSQDEGKGCACSTDGDPKDLGALLLGLALGLSRRRRRG